MVKGVVLTRTVIAQKDINCGNLAPVSRQKPDRIPGCRAQTAIRRNESYDIDSLHGITCRKCTMMDALTAIMAIVFI
jgi:hypothetical protein